MGGLGKTQLAVEFAWHYRNDYPNGVIWLTADQDIDSQLIRLSDEAVWLHPRSESEDKIQVAKHRLKTFNDCLIIFDNLEQFSAIEEYLPEARSQVHLLATSREEFSQFLPIELKLLERGESRRLLLTTADRESEYEKEKEAVEDILKELDDLPLALELVGGYLYKRKGISFSVYAESLKEAPLETLEAKYFQDTFTKHDRNLVRTLKINDELLEATPYLREILDVLNWSGSSSMGISLLKALIVPKNGFQFTDALEMAVNLKLLKKESDSERYAIHRLLAKVHQLEIAIETKIDWITTIANRMVDWFQTKKDDFRYLAEYEAEFEHLKEWQTLTGNLSLPEQIRLFWLEGFPYFYRGKYKDSQQCFQKALKLYDELKYSDDSLFADLLDDLGKSLRRLGNFQKALIHNKKSLEIRQKLFGDKHSDTATSFNSNGVSYDHLRKYQKALEYKEKALEIRQELFGDNHPDTANSFNNLGVSYDNLGKPQKALEYKEKALEIRQELFGDNHPDTAKSFNNLGVSYDNLGEPQKALEYKEKALEIRQELLGENHPDTASSFDNVSVSYWLLDNRQKALEYAQKALEYAQKALEIRKELLGENHPDTANSFNNVGMFYSHLHNQQKALEYTQKALEISCEILVNSHPDTILYCKNLILIYLDLEKSEQAKKLAMEFLGHIPKTYKDRKWFETIARIHNKIPPIKKKRRKKVDDQP